MADRSVRITLTVDSKGAVKAVGATEDEMMDLRKTVEKMDKDLLGLERAFQAGLIDASENAQAEVKVLERALKRMTAQGVDPSSAGFQRYKRRLDEMRLGLEDVPQSANRSINTLMNLNRVVSDAPYGFMAIANNIDPLVDSFQRLSRDAGGTTGALRAMISSLAGPAGIAFAISAVTAIVVAAGPKILAFFEKSADKASDFRDGVAEALGTMIKMKEEFDSFVISGELAAEAVTEIDGEMAQLEAQLKRNDAALTMLVAAQDRGASGQAQRIRENNALIRNQIAELENERETYQGIVDRVNQFSRAQEIAARRGAERVEDTKEELDATTELARERERMLAFEFEFEPADLTRIFDVDPVMGEDLAVMQARIEEGIIDRAKRHLEMIEEVRKARQNAFEEAAEASAAQLAANEQEIEATIRQMEVERQKQEMMQRTTEIAVQNAFMQAQSADDVVSAIRQQIKAVIAHYVAEAIGKALVGVPFPLNLAAAAVAGAAAGALFEQVVPSFRAGVTNFGGGLAQVHKDEIIALPRGSSVVSQFDSRAIMAGARAGASSGANRLEAAALRFERTVKALQSQGIHARFDRVVTNTALRETAYHSELTTTSR